MSAKTSVVDQYPATAGEGFGNDHEREVAIAGKEALVVWHGAATIVRESGDEKLAEVALALDADRLAEELRETYGRFGWGTIEVCNLDVQGNELTVVMRDSPIFGGASNGGPVCWHVRASIEVIVSAILAVKATAFEVACEAVNRDYCEFRVSWDLPQPSSEETRGRGARGVFTTANTLIR